jgi:hypothetical protein
MDATAALRLIAELDKPLEATSPNDWRRRVQLIARIALGIAESQISYSQFDSPISEAQLSHSPDHRGVCD